MGTTLGLTFGILIAHFIPGLIVLLSFIISLHGKIDFSLDYKGYSAIIISVGSLVSLACGLVLDSIRYLLTLIPNISKSYRN